MLVLISKFVVASVFMIRDHVTTYMIFSNNKGGTIGSTKDINSKSINSSIIESHHGRDQFPFLVTSTLLICNQFNVYTPVTLLLVLLLHVRFLRQVNQRV